ncbi:MAG: FAD-dependent oxidoreductase [Nitrososphaerota archaeon]|nr:FAD-dependent oxidoreductase [Nitrososphaerota archaeon]MDG6938910.1 FAD-dependent oxidoreductase [Nitrososphaerota archaeon]
MDADIVIIGAGATGLFTALDLSLRGLSVVLIDRQGMLRGTSGRFHGLLHSGARYATTDKAAAVECRQESSTIRRIAGGAVFDVGGLFVSLEGDDDAFADRFLKGMDDSEIECKAVDLAELKRAEPALSPKVRFAASVPDMVVDPFRLFGGVAVLAKAKGARFLLNHNVTGIDRRKMTVKTDRGEVSARLLVNAAGPWADKICAMYGNMVDMMPAIGLMLAYDGRLVDRVINRLRPPSDGDILLPFYGSCILGTTAQVVEDVDDVHIEDDDVRYLVEEGSVMVPALRDRKYSRLYWSARPLLKADDARSASRDFQVLDDEDILTVIGGKLTTSRLMAEKVSDSACQKLGIKAECTTKETKIPVLEPAASMRGTIGEEVYGFGASFTEVEREASS